jgi:hypothetical protein
MIMGLVERMQEAELRRVEQIRADRLQREQAEAEARLRALRAKETPKQREARERREAEEAEAREARELLLASETPTQRYERETREARARHIPGSFSGIRQGAPASSWQDSTQEQRDQKAIERSELARQEADALKARAPRGGRL